MNLNNGVFTVSENKKYRVKDIVITKKDKYVVLDYEGADMILRKNDNLNVNWEFKIRMDNG
jgi:hypothetical protein